MDLQKICYGCFREKEGEYCPYCGFSEKEEQAYLALPLGTILNGRYLTGKVLGVGGFGITYLGYDLTLEIKVAIKEYMPSGMATRNADRYNVQLTGRLENEFRAGENKFLEEARILAKLQNTPNIVAVHNYFRENNTAYFVMEYVDGMSFKSYISRQGGKISYMQALKYLKPVMQALVKVHEMKLLHRDISPDNIYITSNDESRLLDFGAARFAIGDNKSVSVILKHGFAPEEQYSTHGNQGPWTDVYAMAATFYNAITGVLPPDAIERMSADRLQPPSSLGVDIPPAAEAALMKALSVKAAGRFANMSDFIAALDSTSYAYAGGRAAAGTTVAAAQPATAATVGAQTYGYTDAPVQQPAKNGLSKKMWILIGAIGGSVLIIALVLIIVLSSSAKKHKSVYSGGESSAVTTAETQDSQATTPAESTTGLSPTEDGTEAAPSPDVSWTLRSVSEVNAEISLPEYMVSKDGSNAYYYDPSSNRQITIAYLWYPGFPIYSINDVADHLDLLYDHYFLDSDYTSYEDSGRKGDVSVDGRDGFVTICNTVNGDGKEETFYFAAVEGDNDFGCYVMAAGSLADDEDGIDDLLNAMDTFHVCGPLNDINYDMYANQDFNFRIMYPKQSLGGSIVEQEGSKSTSGISCIFMYPIKGSTATYIEVDAPLDQFSTPDEAIDYLENGYTNLGAAIGERQTINPPGTSEWTGFEATAVSGSNNINICCFAADISDNIYVVGVWALEDDYDSAIDLLVYIMSTIRPY